MCDAGCHIRRSFELDVSRGGSSRINHTSLISENHNLGCDGEVIESVGTRQLMV
ncbi:hypothetical protein BDV29DRAFT_173378 [Aspergillus leporis]|uniref:Uncharacterized protein n=1 Tax=Aspergillus leporis TaxID=41062 RepID=A0A5N5X5H0_9EURO|nr:hypothetical protein BDV29DRAFT_173378 [Aspergillus leporis]